MIADSYGANYFRSCTNIDVTADFDISNNCHLLKNQAIRAKGSTWMNDNAIRMRQQQSSLYLAV